MKNLDGLKAFDRIKDCLQDYANDFMALSMIVRSSEGILGVQKIFEEGFKVKSIEEYLAENPNRMTEEERKDEVFIQKSAELDALAVEINTNIESMTKEKLEEIIESARKIFHY